MFQRGLLIYLHISAKTLVLIYQTKRRHIQMTTVRTQIAQSHLDLCALQDELPERVIHVTREDMVGCVVDVEPQCTQTILMCARRKTGVAR